MNLISEEPKIYTIDNMLTEEECQHFIDISNEKFQRSLVTGNDGNFVSHQRTSQNYWLPHNKDDITLKVAKKIAALVNYPLENAEMFQIIYYTKGQEYYNHCDGWHFDKSEESKRCLLRGGQRMVTALVYLNNVEEGGATKFTKLNISVSPERGKLLVFYNCKKGTNIVDTRSEHTGMNVLSGEKYAFNLWFRQQPLNTEYIHKY
jgi:prolyl 4-hydroxylase